mmetsp:Transcript_6767/g.14416  ORF Transcript_6767/g.14416 Transcript_6767/m.14416 type:complete len:509 (+) Transcript_6767:96-1622(+)
MEFPNKLETLEHNQRASWNDDIEEYLGKPRAPSQNSISIEFDDGALQSSLEKIALELEKELGTSFKSCETDQHDTNIGSAVRTGKNILRWYIQIYLEQRQVQRRRHKSQDVCKINILRSPDTLSNVFSILRRSAEGRNRNLMLARDASLYIFYATYGHFPGDVSASNGIDHLINKQAFPRICLEILTKADSIPLALTLVRNLHSMTVSFPGAQTSILRAEIHCDPSMVTQSAPWAVQELTTINFSKVCLLLIKWSLDNGPSFPTENLEDKRVELVVEILNCFYAMRKGQELVAPSSGISADDDHPSLGNLIIRILQLSPAAKCDYQSRDDVIPKRINECKLSAISLLMDSDASFGKYLMENDSFGTLLEVFKHQVDDTVDNTKLDSSATATIVPILVVLNRYSMANSDVRLKVKEFVYPRETEKKIQKKFIEEKKKTNMSPLDAPKDTLRGKLVILLSWVDGYVKRCCAELMWTLCDSDYATFTSRVGLGNALPLLNSKGLSPIPIPS